MLLGSAFSVLLCLGVLPDCNENGVPDLIDIADGTSSDCNGDQVPDECQPCLDCDGNGWLDECELETPSGLVGQYWTSNDDGENVDGRFFRRILTRIDQAIDFEWGGGAPDPLLGNDHFVVTWTGLLYPESAGSYTFITSTDDGVRLWVDDVLIIDKWVNQATAEWEGSITLSGTDPVSFRMDYYEAGGGATARLEWKPPLGVREVVPGSAFQPMVDLDGDGWPDLCGDCDQDGIPDAAEVLYEGSPDCNNNCRPDDCDTALYPSLGYWRFEIDSPYGDSSGSGLDGSPSNSSIGSDPPIGEVPQTNEVNISAAELGGNGRVVVEDPGNILAMGPGGLTIEAWVRLDVLSNTSGSNQRQVLVQRKVIGTSDVATDYLALVQSGNLADTSNKNYGKQSGFSGRELLLLISDGQASWTATANLEINDYGWHHVSFSYDPRRFRVNFSLDGEFETVVVGKTAAVTNGAELVIGAHTNASNAFNHFLRGAVDEVRIAAGVLSEELLLSSYASGDCNGNLNPDGCDIDDGLAQDCDGNGQPDSCLPDGGDCNSNGISDPCDVADGTSEDCNGDNVPDECQLKGNDCDLDGIPDDCQLTDETDCNGNGIYDACDIASGVSLDCQEDGIPDECQLASQLKMQYDDGGAEYGVRSVGTKMIWMTSYEVQPGASTLDAIEFQSAFYPEGNNYVVIAWTDPNGDSSPVDSQAIWTKSVTAPDGLGNLTVQVPDLDMGTPGTSFFIGVKCSVTTDDFPAALDVTGGPAIGRNWIIGSDGPIDNNDLSNGVLAIQPIEQTLFPGNWVLRPIMRLDVDCDGNGVLDDCDIQANPTLDIDENGVLDSCEDCNSNGVLDSVDIASGFSVDCQGDGIPDDCQIDGNDCNGDGIPDGCQLVDSGPAVYSGFQDCNNNGIPDRCDIASGIGLDRNGDGVLNECDSTLDCNGNGFEDALDIVDGYSEDCDGDGVPDECQYGDPLEPRPYVYDDGTRESNVGVVAPVYMAWTVHFDVVPGGEWISAVDVCWGNTVAGQPAEVVIWSDPNGDGLMADSVVLGRFSTVTQDVNSSTYTRVPIAPVNVGEAPRSFFVGVYYDDRWNTAPSAVDIDWPSSGKSWLYYSLDPLDLDDLVNSAEVEILWTNYDNMVRAVGGDGHFVYDCNSNTVLDSCDIANGDSFDGDGNGIPDECVRRGDRDRDDDIDIDDLIALLGDWGKPGGIGPGQAVGSDDLLMLLSRWGRVYR
ncbi:MAG: PA14 domain-containing protein [Phycisphaerales bacterium]|nr:PA14 domain-containing protein [Phycisphaerales bacterium]